MCGPAVIVAAAVAAQAFMQSEGERAQKLHESSVVRANAVAMRQQAEVERKKGEYEQRTIDSQREAMRRDYADSAGSNRALMAASGVDISSGSAQDVLVGNADRFASDIGENRLAHAWAGWESRHKVAVANWQADVQDNQANWLKKTSGSLGKSLLGAAIKGVGTYAAAGGSFGSAASSSGGGMGHVFDGDRAGQLGFGPGGTR